jgi:hypothetical protein
VREREREKERERERERERRAEIHYKTVQLDHPSMITQSSNYPIINP